MAMKRIKRTARAEPEEESPAPRRTARTAATRVRDRKIMEMIEADEAGEDVSSDNLMPLVQRKDRLTIVLQIRHEHSGDQPQALDSIFEKYLDLEHDPYSRRVAISGEWQQVDLGWIPPDDVGLVVIDNLAGVSNRATRPTKEEREEELAKVLELSYTKNSEEADLVYPRSSFPKFSKNAGNLYIRCQAGETEYRVHVFSK